MIGALAIKNRRKKLGVSEEPVGPPPRSIYFQRCHLLYVISGCSLIVGLVLLIPGFFGDSPFFIYAASSLGVALICFLLACIFTPFNGDDDINPVNNNTDVSGGGMTTATDDDVESAGNPVATTSLINKAALLNGNNNSSSASKSKSEIDLMAGTLNCNSPDKRRDPATKTQNTLPLTVIES
jgi:hypothetical protein